MPPRASVPQGLKEPAPPKVPAGITAAAPPDLEDDAFFRSALFAGADLSSRRAEGVEFESCRLVDTSFAGAELPQAGFVDVELERCDLSNMRARSSGVRRATVSASRLTGAAWPESTLTNVVFDTCRADLAVFRFTTFKTAMFRDCALPEADFQNADLRGAVFERCDLTRAQFSGARMEGARFSDCVLAGIGGVTSLRGVTVKATDAQGLVYGLASAMGITIEG